MFGDSSPISKALCVGNFDEDDGTNMGEADDYQFIPNFSLGLSQITPKNLRTDIDASADSAMKGLGVVSNILTKGKNQMEGVSDDTEAQQKVRDIENKFAGILRPRRGIKASHFCRSPFVSRVIDVSDHQITTEERNVWDWLFKTRQNVK